MITLLCVGILLIVFAFWLTAATQRSYWDGYDYGFDYGWKLGYRDRKDEIELTHIEEYFRGYSDGEKQERDNQAKYIRRPKK